MPKSDAKSQRRVLATRPDAVLDMFATGADRRDPRTSYVVLGADRRQLGRACKTAEEAWRSALGRLTGRCT